MQHGKDPTFELCQCPQQQRELDSKEKARHQSSHLSPDGDMGERAGLDTFQMETCSSLLKGSRRVPVRAGKGLVLLPMLAQAPDRLAAAGSQGLKEPSALASPEGEGQWVRVSLAAFNAL